MGKPVGTTPTPSVGQYEPHLLLDDGKLKEELQVTALLYSIPGIVWRRTVTYLFWKIWVE
jgi:hypothetical protein